MKRLKGIFYEWARGRLRIEISCVANGSPCGTREAPKPGEERCQMGRVLLRHRRKFQSQSLARLTMPHNGLDPDLAFLDKKVEPGFRIHWL
jgi:hypothetical protein